MNILSDLKNSKTINKRKGKQVLPTEKPSELIQDTESLGKMIKYKRTQAMLTLERAALLCGVSEKTLRALESGKDVKTSTLIKVYKSLGLKMKLLD